ncbi:caspase family protein [Streptomyces sporangiiformans]|uniref:Uncharacterized protein n=1 Tax=Streptomyces sporangiiformans TaxID=2315329 RepID=A0A505DM64_9ACTN|nr:caspase family protein [Streptomyces sporangiiformans]TPQ21876.1 hypothetical protein FGD71_012615 [Streptomyces sporangiiformans]
MTDKSERARHGRRLLVATAVTRYANQPQWDRPDLVEANRQIVDLFTGIGYTHLAEIGLDPTAAELTNSLRDICRRQVRPEDYLVVYLAGHGEILDDGGHVLLTSDTDPDDIDDALPTMTLATKMLRGTGVQRLLLLLDTCYSGQGGNEFTAAALAGMRRNWTLTDRSGLVVVTSSQPLEQADTGAFPRLFSAAVHSDMTAGRKPAILDLGAVVEVMNSHHARPPHQRIGWGTVGLTGAVPGFLPNPRHRASTVDTDLHFQQAVEWQTQIERRNNEFHRHFLVRAMGGHGEEPAWWFSGRHAALADITSWLGGPGSGPPAVVVTAGPGSGKTAVLGLVAALTRTDYRRTVPLETLALPAAATPAQGSVDIAIYAGGLTHDQVLAGLAAAARVEADTVSRLIAAMAAQRPAPARPFTAIIDALDEAVDPHQLITQVLLPIITAGRGIRLLLGTRPHLLPSLMPDTSGEPSDSIRTIQLDEPPHADRAALVEYTIRSLLEARPGSPYLRTSPERLRAVAGAVADASYPSFLVARITTATLAAADHVADANDGDWRAELPRVPGDAMRQDLDVRLGHQAQRARELLRPLAYAEGQGLPWENIWASLAGRISGRRFTDADLFWLREHTGSYVVEAVEDGRSTYRLYHQALAEHLRTDTESRIAVAAVHQAFVEVLTRIPSSSRATSDWTRAHPYAIRHLATHAAISGAIDALVMDGDYLVHADPETLLPALEHVRTEAGRLVRTTYYASASQHRYAAPAARRQLLAIDAARSKAPVSLRKALNNDLVWSPRWATGRLVNPALRTALTGHDQSVNAVACAKVDGVPFAVTGAGNGTDPSSGELIVWDLRDGRRHATLAHLIEPVNAVACGEVDGTPVAVAGTGTQDGPGEVLIWDLRTGRLRATLSGHAQRVTAIAIGRIDGAPVVVTGASNARIPGQAFSGQIGVWDLRTGRRLDTFSVPWFVSAVACAQVDGDPIALIGGMPLLLAWNLRTGRERARFHSHPQGIRTIACAEVDGVPVAVVGGMGASGGNRGDVFVWDLRTGRRRADLIGHGSPVNGVACINVEGVPLAVTGDVGDGSAGQVWIWDLHTGEPRASLTGHTSPVDAVACAQVDGVPVAITGSRWPANEALVWDLRTRHRHTTTKNRHRPISAVACATLDGNPIAVTGAGDASTGGEVLVWDLYSGEQRNFPTGPISFIRSVACIECDTGPVVVVNSGFFPFPGLANTSKIPVFDLRTGRKRVELIGGHTNDILAVGCAMVDGDPIAVTCGWWAGELFVWNLRTGQLRGALTGHSGSVNAVAFAQVNGVPVAVTGGGHGKPTGQVFVWDIRTCLQRAALDGHRYPVNAVACTVVNGIPMAITGGGDRGGGEMRVWDLRTGHLLAAATHSQAINTLACTDVDGIPYAVVGTGGRGDRQGGQIHLWNLLSGTNEANLVMPYRVMAIACAERPNNVLVVSALHELIALEVSGKPNLIP